MTKLFSGCGYVRVFEACYVFDTLTSLYFRVEIFLEDFYSACLR